MLSSQLLVYYVLFRSHWTSKYYDIEAFWSEKKIFFFSKKSYLNYEFHITKFKMQLLFPPIFFSVQLINTISLIERDSTTYRH